MFVRQMFLSKRQGTILIDRQSNFIIEGTSEEMRDKTTNNLLIKL